MCVCMCVCVSAFVCECMCARVYVFMYVCVYANIAYKQNKTVHATACNIYLSTTCTHVHTKCYQIWRRWCVRTTQCIINYPCFKMFCNQLLV